MSNKKNYQIFNMGKDIQVLVKKTVQEDGYKIDFLCYPENSDKEVEYSLNFQNIELRDALFDLITSTTEYSKKFITEIYEHYLKDGLNQSNASNSNRALTVPVSKI